MNVELFGCAGGVALGFRRAGVEFGLCVDWDKDACDSYEQNLGRRPLQMDARDFLRALAHFAPRARVELICADPPCTPWSRAGSRKGLADERDMLRETVALIRALRPKCWLIGNVPGLNDAPNWPVVQSVIGGLAKDGYCVDYASLDACWYGVPQRRVRPWWFGHAAGSACIRWPAPTHGDPASLGSAALGETRKPWVTCREALAHLSLDDLGKPIRVRAQERHHKPSNGALPARTLTRNTHADGALISEPHGHPCSTPDKPAPCITQKSGRAGQRATTLLLNAKHPINRPDEPGFTVSTKGDGRGAQGACVMEWPWDRPATTVSSDERIGPPGHHEGGSFLSAREIDRPATTLTTRDEISRPGRNGRRESQSTNAIKLSERAALILQGFPEGAVVCGEHKRSRWAQIGMATPVPMAEAVARAVVEQMGRSAERPKRSARASARAQRETT